MPAVLCIVLCRRRYGLENVRGARLRLHARQLQSGASMRAYAFVHLGEATAHGVLSCDALCEQVANVAGFASSAHLVPRGRVSLTNLSGAQPNASPRIGIQTHMRSEHTC